MINKNNQHYYYYSIKYNNKNQHSNFLKLLLNWIDIVKLLIILSFLMISCLGNGGGITRVVATSTTTLFVSTTRRSAAFVSSHITRRNLKSSITTPQFPNNYNYNIPTTTTNNNNYPFQYQHGISTFPKSHFSSALLTCRYASPNNDNNDNNNDTSQEQQQQSFSTSKKSDNWVVPQIITVPDDSYELSFVRASGAGGQNVNKVNTKAELRFPNILTSQTWLPLEVRERLIQQQSNRLAKSLDDQDKTLVLQVQEYRTQAQNKKLAITKLQDMILQAYPRPKVRKMRKGISKKAKERNREMKKRRSEVKKSRGRVDF